MLEKAKQCRGIPNQKCFLLKAVLVALLQLSFLKTILNLYFSMGADNEQIFDNFNFRTEDLSTDLFTDKGQDFGRGITTVTDKKIQAKHCSV